MSKLSPRFMALLTRAQLAEMLAKSYASWRNVDPNEAYARLEDGLRDLRLISGLQQGTHAALVEARPKLDEAGLEELVSKKLSKSRQYKALPSKRSSEGPIAALTIAIDLAAGLSSGEAYDLLESREGERMLEEALRLLGAHLAKEILR